MNKGIKIEIYHTDERGNFARTLYPRKVSFRGRSFVVPAGFEFDGASIPRLFRAPIGSPLDPETARTGCDHDFIYKTQPEGWTRKEADLMFLCDLIEDGLPPDRAFLAYLGVRIFGGFAWKENRIRLEAEAFAFWKGEEK